MFHSTEHRDRDSFEFTEIVIRLFVKDLPFFSSQEDDIDIRREQFDILVFTTSVDLSFRFWNGFNPRLWRKYQFCWIFSNNEYKLKWTADDQQIQLQVWDTVDHEQTITKSNYIFLIDNKMDLSQRKVSQTDGADCDEPKNKSKYREFGRWCSDLDLSIKTSRLMRKLSLFHVTSSDFRRRCERRKRAER
jgi:hypothetical protein